MNKKKKFLKMMLDNKVIATIDEHGLSMLIEQNNEFSPNLKQWFDDCFYGLADMGTFDKQYKAVEENRYFCYSKPALKLIACEIDI